MIWKLECIALWLEYINYSVSVNRFIELLMDRFRMNLLHMIDVDCWMLIKRRNLVNLVLVSSFLFFFFLIISELLECIISTVFYCEFFVWYDC